MNVTREERIEMAFFRGGALTLANSEYLDSVRTLTGILFETDIAKGDLTAKALAMKNRHASASIITREGGVVAGIDELALFLRGHGIDLILEKTDGDSMRPDETLLQVEGDEAALLSLERVGLNLLQRMSGIATAARCLQARVRSRGSATRIVGTRKTPWGLLDKRALHLGGVGTHRLGLGDAVLIKNNHLALLADTEEAAAPIAIEKAWEFRAKSAFIEVEVRGEEAARAAARTFRRLQEGVSETYPCVLMLDNMTSAQAQGIIAMLRRENLWDQTLTEVSGGVSEANLEAYAVCGADAISVGALTHSARALDLCQRIS